MARVTWCSSCSICFPRYDQRRAGSPTAVANLHGIECYHVNARVSKELEDIGDFRLGKLFLLFGYCVQAIWCRFRYGVRTLYYIPAPGKHSALYRDWLVMFLCRPFYPRVILHWHAAGLAVWLETAIQRPARVFTFHPDEGCRFEHCPFQIQSR